MAQWIPGWSETPPQPGDGILAMVDGIILKPGEGWLISWSDAQAAVADNHRPTYLGQLDGRPVYVCGLDADKLSAQTEQVSLRDALVFMENSPAEMLGLAHQVQQWWQDHQYCGRCGQPTVMHALERARWCEPCGIPWYPRLAPCVIVVIRRDDRMLLARSSRFKRYFFSLIAGFVEPGESLEEAVKREVKEETGLDVSGIRYHSSQPWPFPHQLMLGFFADYAGGELVLQEDEIAEADWFAPGELPPVSPPTTIAGQLIRAMEKEILG